MAEPIYRPKGNPRRVNGHGFEDKKLGKVVPIVPAPTHDSPGASPAGRPSSLSRKRPAPNGMADTWTSMV
jgi:hypothetical protein